MIAVSVNVGSGVHLIKPAKLCMCMQNNTKHEDGRTAPGVCGNGSVPLSYSGERYYETWNTHTSVILSLDHMVSIPPVNQ